MKALALVAPLLLAACAAVAPVEPQSGAVRGRNFAARTCAGCHDLNREGRSLFFPAPPFRTLAPASPEAIQAFAADLNRHHRMPRFMLSDADARDLYAYIRTLQSSDPQDRLPDVPPLFVRGW